MQTLKGMFDIIDEGPYYAFIRKTFEDVVRRFHGQKIETPILESTELFHRGLGDASDVVRKETYTFNDRGERSVTLRPEGTASVVRALIQHKLYTAACRDQSYYYEGPMFRYERPQKGRYRQFYSAGVERFGSASFRADVEIITMAYTIIQELGLKATVEINSLGPTHKAAYIDALKDHLTPYLRSLSADDQTRFQLNPLRILDSKDTPDHAAFQSIPLPEAYLSDAEKAHYQGVKDGLTALNIPFIQNPRLVRGLDYYTQTVFEIKVSEDVLGHQNTLIGGGRYDHLVKELGGPDWPAIGFGMGLERCVVALKALNHAPKTAALDVYIVTLGDVLAPVLTVAQHLRDAGFSVKIHPDSASLKTQFKQVEHEKAHWALIIGEDEVKTNTYTLKDQIHAAEHRVSFDDLIATLSSHGADDAK